MLVRRCGPTSKMVFRCLRDAICNDRTLVRKDVRPIFLGATSTRMEAKSADLPEHWWWNMVFGIIWANVGGFFSQDPQRTFKDQHILDYRPGLWDGQIEAKTAVPAGAEWGDGWCGCWVPGHQLSETTWRVWQRYDIPKKSGWSLFADIQTAESVAAWSQSFSGVICSAFGEFAKARSRPALGDLVERVAELWSGLSRQKPVAVSSGYKPDFIVLHPNLRRLNPTGLHGH